ncbi:FAD-dependent oxidoreductase [Salipiger mucosus]|uniref:Glycerol-3-phosphate dehydrogenase n=1 Tax=Salipiger mucosus DSM 16094 TaxID=1123237 RepID=S9QJ08_9RHOB|nr:FAD-dependent oxidoreductase [Salipiger mucosus]EPX79797.1 Glycerol-3-phosphate dehydrogenase [Salipiger mucosus DSM 16094]
MTTEPQPSSVPGPHDVIVIGGGVNGTAALRELARAGYRVLLAEADDLGSGASGRSSRMLHCGLRYLESPRPLRDAIRHPLRFARALGMAREAMRARAELAEDASVGTRAIELGFPVWRDGPFPRWQLDAGLRLLGAVAPGGPPLDRRVLDAEATRAHPIGRHLRDPDDLRGMVAFREYLFDAPERICVDNALEAEAYGAALHLRSRAELRERGPDGLWRVGLEDAQGTREVTARAVLNMAGTWADDVGSFDRRLVRGTKGAHMVIRLPEGFAGRGIATVHRGGHPFYGLPLGGDRFYFGPTETLYEGDARGVRADADDLAFLLAEANHLLPGLNLSERDVEQCWAGVRPLTEDPDRPMGARERRVHDLGQGVLAMTAGPVMSHRSAGRRMLQEVSARIGKPATPGQRSLRTPAQAGDDAEALAVTHEHAPDLWGVLAPRTGAVWQGPLSRDRVEASAGRLAPLFGWNAEQTIRQVEQVLGRQDRVFGVPQTPDERRAEPAA